MAGQSMRVMADSTRIGNFSETKSKRQQTNWRNGLSIAAAPSTFCEYRSIACVAVTQPRYWAGFFGKSTAPTSYFLIFLGTIQMFTLNWATRSPKKAKIRDVFIFSAKKEPSRVLTSQVTCFPSTNHQQAAANPRRTRVRWHWWIPEAFALP